MASRRECLIRAGRYDQPWLRVQALISADWQVGCTSEPAFLTIKIFRHYQYLVKNASGEDNVNNMGILNIKLQILEVNIIPKSPIPTMGRRSSQSLARCQCQLAGSLHFSSAHYAQPGQLWRVDRLTMGGQVRRFPLLICSWIYFRT